MFSDKCEDLAVAITQSEEIADIFDALRGIGSDLDDLKRATDGLLEIRQQITTLGNHIAALSDRLAEVERRQAQAPSELHITRLRQDCHEARRSASGTLRITPDIYITPNGGPTYTLTRHIVAVHIAGAKTVFVEGTDAQILREWLSLNSRYIGHEVREQAGE